MLHSKTTETKINKTKVNETKFLFLSRLKKQQQGMVCPKCPYLSNSLFYVQYINYAIDHCLLISTSNMPKYMYFRTKEIAVGTDFLSEMHNIFVKPFLE